MHLPLLIRAMVPSLAIPEHEVYQQARRSKWQAGLAFFVAPWRSYSNPPFPLLGPRLHLIGAFKAGRYFSEFTSAPPPSILTVRFKKLVEKL
jgi:hypothetical protein